MFDAPNLGTIFFLAGKIYVLSTSPTCYAQIYCKIPQKTRQVKYKTERNNVTKSRVLNWVNFSILDSQLGEF